jgi:hypothetical protein
MSFDISSLSVTESTELHLKHPTEHTPLFDGDASKPITITVASQSSREYREVVNTISNRRLRREQAAARNGGKNAQAFTVEVAQEESLEMLSALCLGSSNLVYNGKAVKSNADFRELLSDGKMLWVRSQVDAAVGDLELFIKGSSTR